MIVKLLNWLTRYILLMMEIYQINNILFVYDNLITCYSNDYGFKNWIKKVLEHYAKLNDLVILLVRVEILML